MENKGIVTTYLKDGKRGFRVYPSWDTPVSKQALQTQYWQASYFMEDDNQNSAVLLQKLLQA